MTEPAPATEGPIESMAPAPVKEQPKEKPAPKAVAASQQPLPSRMIEVKTEYGTRIWIQKSAIMAVREGIVHRFTQSTSMDASQPRATIYNVAGGEWQVTEDAEELVKAIS